MAQKRFEAMGNRDAAVIEAQGLANHERYKATTGSRNSSLM